MNSYRSAQQVSGFRIPVGIFVLALLGVTCGLLWWNPEYLTSSVVRPQVLISEIQASNWTTLADSDGDYSDWIEIHNPGNESRNLTGWYLTDDFRQLTRWQFPEIELEPGAFLVVFASGKDRSQFLDDLHTNFMLDETGEYLALVDPSGTKVVHEFLPKFPRHKGDESYGIRAEFFSQSFVRSPGAYRSTALFGRPSPGGPNKGEIWGQVADTRFSRKGGFVEQPFRLILKSKTPQAPIRYTTDGSWPSDENGQVYKGPVTIDRTTVVRAATFKERFKSSNTDTQTYLFADSLVMQNGQGLPESWGVKGDWAVPADYEMDPEVVGDDRYRARLVTALKAIPSLSLALDPGALFDRDLGIYSNSENSGRAWERPGSIELLFLKGEGGKEFRTNCGVRIQGGLSRRPEESPKHSFRIVFREQYGSTTELRYPLFGENGAKRFKNIILRAGWNNSWLHGNSQERARGDLLRDEWMRHSMTALGRPSVRGRFVHLFLNGLYWGVYNLCERPDASFLAATLGGNPTDYDSRNASNVLMGDAVIWNRLFEVANGGLEAPERCAVLAKILDVESFVDFMLVQFYGGSSDWQGDLNWYAGRRRKPGERYQFFGWDGERALESLDDIITHVDRDFTPARLFHRLRENPDFRQLFRERARSVLGNGGALSPEASRQRYEELAATIRDAIVLEAVRWGDYRRDVHSYQTGPYERYEPDSHWEKEVQRLLDTYFPQRTARVIEQLKDINLW
ncbi:MAG: hypothetical protein M2R45_04113 [Verrucomicrobia subdivision 3 bacterium]|nr:hypothetical protein [Limisphaerales bacterium]MCS1417086.1 hypothetical protein [Limisphaerales bacterium]